MSNIGVAAWIKPSNANAEQTVLAFGTTNETNSFGLSYHKWERLCATISGAGQFCSSSSILTYDAWQLVAVSWSSTTKVLRMNVTPVGATAASASFNTTNVSPLTSSAGCLTLGRAGNGPCNPTTGFFSTTAQLIDSLGEVRWTPPFVYLSSTRQTVGQNNRCLIL